MAEPRPTKRRVSKKKSKSPTTTTIKVSRRVMKYIETNALQDESVDETLRRLLKLATNGQPKAQGPLPMTTTIKVSNTVMGHIREKAKAKESRDMTLGRLLGVELEDGNLSGSKTAPTGLSRESTSVKPNDGNVRVKA